MNPFLSKFDTPFETIPFDRIEPAHFLPALESSIELAKKGINEICDNQATPSFSNVIEALDYTGKEVGLVARTFFNLNSAETNDEIQKIAKEFSPKLTEHSNDVLLNETLFKKVKAVFDQKENLGLNAEETTLLEKTYKDFARNGALLDSKQKEELREIDKELSSLKLQYGENVLKETNDYFMLLESEDDLAGLPGFVKEAASLEAKNRGHEGKWVITLDYPSYIPFMTYSTKREKRKELNFAFSDKASKGNELDNKENILKIINLRQKRAELLGYKNHAEFTLEERMAGSSDKVLSFLEDLRVRSLPFGQKEIAELNEYAKKLDGIDELQSWDYAFYFEKLKKERFDIDDEALKPYLKLENVVDGVFLVAKKLFGLNFVEREDIPKYHSDVRTFEVRDEEGKFISIFYADFFPRPGKRNGAWMTSYRDQSRDEVGSEIRPHISIVCNFTKPTESTPSLLTFNEVTTLFHEFGHALHGMLADTKYPSLSGTNVYWDFVELPSQVLENWAYEKECLDLFAVHYETGEKIPEYLVEKIKESSNFHEGYRTLRQLSFGLLDMAWHSSDPSEIKDVKTFEKNAMESTRLLPITDSGVKSCSFGHIFQGGYSAGYYSYKWAEVLDADAFEHFKEKGIFNKDVADSFRNNILSKGGSEHPMTLYKRFRGAEPSAEALLRRGGLI